VLAESSRRTGSTPRISLLRLREKECFSGPEGGNRAFLLVGNEDWPFPSPLVKMGGKWSFDAKAGRRELLFAVSARRLTPFRFVTVTWKPQHEYASSTHEGYDVNQYAQRIIARPASGWLGVAKRDGSWGGPIGEKIAVRSNRVIRAAPSHTTVISLRFSKGKDPLRRSAKWIF
jgi:hypothetical protein